jgi:hypothetical protein
MEKMIKELCRKAFVDCATIIFDTEDVKDEDFEAWWEKNKPTDRQMENY